MIIGFDLSKYSAQCGEYVANIWYIDSNVVNLWVTLIFPIPSPMWRTCKECVMIDFDLSKYIAKRDEFVANIYDVDLKVANLWVIKICSI